MTSMWLHPFYQIVDSAQWLERLLPVGVKFVQIRLKNIEPEAIKPQVMRARDVCNKFAAQLVVNDYWEVAIDLGCDFIHLGQEDLAAADMKAIRRAGLKVGLSTHDRDELDIAMSHAPDYVALGPIYPTVLKKMAFGPQGVERITEWKGLIGDTPLVAIGGLKVEHAAGVFAAGADCASVVTDVLLNDDPEKRTQEWLDAVKAEL